MWPYLLKCFLVPIPSLCSSRSEEDKMQKVAHGAVLSPRLSTVVTHTTALFSSTHSPPVRLHCFRSGGFPSETRLRAGHTPLPLQNRSSLCAPLTTSKAAPRRITAAPSSSAVSCTRARRAFVSREKRTRRQGRRGRGAGNSPAGAPTRKKVTASVAPSTLSTFGSSPTRAGQPLLLR